MFDLYRDVADRLIAIGEVDLGLVTRRTLIELLGGLTGRLGDLARVHLAAALTDLARDLTNSGRSVEAEALAAEAAAMGQSPEPVPAAGTDPADKPGAPSCPAGVLDTAATGCFVCGDDRHRRWDGRSDVPFG